MNTGELQIENWRLQIAARHAMPQFAIFNLHFSIQPRAHGATAGRGFVSRFPSAF
jgi:hypothetical protein